MTYLEKFRSSKLNASLQRFLRVLQFLSPVISLALFASRLAKIYRLQHRLSHSNGAVAGILAAAILYTLAAMILQFLLKHGGPKILRWLLMILDLLFMGAFIAVAYLTRPQGGSSGPCHSKTLGTVNSHHQNCNLPWGTLILAIISTILHFLTAMFHEVKDHKYNKENRNGIDGHENGNGRYGDRV